MIITMIALKETAIQLQECVAKADFVATVTVNVQTIFLIVILIPIPAFSSVKSTATASHLAIIIVDMLFVSRTLMLENASVLEITNA